MTLRTSLSIRYISDITRRAAQDARAMQRLERIGSASMARLGRQLNRAARQVGQFGRNIAGIGAAGAGGALAYEALGFDEAMARFEAEAQLTKEQAKRARLLINRVATDKTVRLGRSNTANLARTLFSRLGNPEQALRSLLPAAHFMNSQGTDPETTAALVLEGNQYGARTQEDYDRFLARQIQAGAAGSLVSSKRAGISERISSAYRRFVGNTREYSPQELEPVLQAYSISAGTPERLAEGFNSLVDDLFILGIENFTDKEGRRLPLMESIDKVLDAHGRDAGAIVRSKRLSQPTRHLLSSFLDKGAQEKHLEVSDAMQESPEGVLQSASRRVADSAYGRARGAGSNIAKHAEELLLPPAVRGLENASSNLDTWREEFSVLRNEGWGAFLEHNKRRGQAVRDEASNPQPQPRAELRIDVRAEKGTRARVRGIVQQDMDVKLGVQGSLP